MFDFGFEKDLINEVVVKWVSTHHNAPECRKVLDTHEAAQRLNTPESAEAYHLALRELWVVRPWDCGDIGLNLLPRRSTVLVG